ncbi:hypothetical protein AAG906_011321 [Vitis piasezkii]
MGQRKRVQLARLLALNRPIWLLDEPSVALDDEGIEDAMQLRLPPRFPRRMTHVDMLDRSDWIA